MHPEIFGFVKSYGLMLAISFALGLWLSLRRARRYGIAPEKIIDLVFGVFVSSLIGVRLAFVLTHLDEFDPWYHVFFIWDGGLTLYGGIILAIIAVWYLTRRAGIPFLVMADIFSPGVALGIGLTRIGCFLAGCCYGHPTECALGVVFPDEAAATRQFGPVPVHPAQIYASVGGFLVCGLLLLWERIHSCRGCTFGRFLALYGLSRFVVDFFRHYEADQVLAFGWSNNQWLSLVLVGIGLAIMIRNRRLDSLTGRAEAGGDG
jgi:phosphatidylglycerol:prolipoprotein diacylglycerol transferase